MELRMAAPADQDRDLVHAGPALRRLNAAMVCVGLAAFALLYTTQALLPDIARTFGVSASVAALSVSVTTGAVAFAVLPMSAWAERVGRTRVMLAGLAAACAAAVGAAVSPALWVLLVFRGLDGVALAGVVAVAVGHIGSTVHPDVSSAAIGVYVAGTSVGGLLGRIVPSGIGMFASWRWSLAALSLIGAICAMAFAVLNRVAASPAHRPPAQPERGIVRAHLHNPGVVRMCIVAFFGMGGFVAAYNYLTFRLRSHHFDLSASTAGLVFFAYLAGTASSPVAARLVARHARRTIALASVAVALLGLALTTSRHLSIVLAGLVIFTAGFFALHSTASSWTSALAGHHRSHAAALYLAAYYLGSALGGWLIGFAWSAGGWTAAVAYIAACFAVVGVVVISAATTGSQSDR